MFPENECRDADFDAQLDALTRKRRSCALVVVEGKKEGHAIVEELPQLPLEICEMRDYHA